MKTARVYLNKELGAFEKRKPDRSPLIFALKALEAPKPVFLLI